MVIRSKDPKVDVQRRWKERSVKTKNGERRKEKKEKKKNEARW